MRANKLLVFFTLIISLIVPLNPSYAVQMDNSIGYIYGGFGPLWGAPYDSGTIRIGRNNWEFGILGAGSYGIVKVLRAPSTIVCFGLAYAGTAGGGLYASIGKEWGVFKWLAIRGELAATMLHTGFGSGVGLFGLTIHI